MSEKFFEFPNSSALLRGSYRPQAKDLIVLFTSKRGYVYSDVEQETVDALLAAESAGKYFMANIKHKFPFREIEA